MNDPPPSPRRQAPAVPPTFDAVVSRAMAKAPEDRYPSAGDLGRAALAAAEGTATHSPERSVATGAAAAGAAAATAAWGAEQATASGPAPRRTPAYGPGQGRTATGGPGRTRAQPAHTGPANLPETQTPARRRRWPIVAAVAVLALVLAGSATALVATGALDGDSGETTGDNGGGGGGGGEDPTSPPAPNPPPQPPPSGSPPPAQPPAQPTPTTGSQRFDGEGFSADYPQNWSLVQAEAPEGTGGLIRTEWGGPTGGKVLVDYLPGDSSSPREQLSALQASAGVETISERDITLGGRPAVEWVFVDDEGDRQVDYFLNVDGQSFAVLGSGEDFEKTARVAQGVADSVSTS